MTDLHQSAVGDAQRAASDPWAVLNDLVGVPYPHLNHAVLLPLNAAQLDSAIGALTAHIATLPSSEANDGIGGAVSDRLGPLLTTLKMLRARYAPDAVWAGESGK